MSTFEQATAFDGGAVPDPQGRNEPGPPGRSGAEERDKSRQAAHGNFALGPLDVLRLLRHGGLYIRGQLPVAPVRPNRQMDYANDQ